MAPDAKTCSANRWTPLLAAILTAAALGCGPPERPGGDAAACDPSEPRLASQVRDWFSSLEGLAPEAPAIDRFLAESAFEFPLTEGEDPGPGTFRAWVSDLRSSHPQVEYRLDAIRTDPAGDDRVRARFEFERRGVDVAGTPHVARREQTWLVRDLPGAIPAVLRIDEQRLLAFPGTGPQIVCY